MSIDGGLVTAICTAVGVLFAGFTGAIGLLWRRCLRLEETVRVGERERREYAERQLALVSDRELSQVALLERVEALVAAQSKPYRAALPSGGRR